MARPMKPLVRGGGYYPSNGWTPLVYPGGYTTMDSVGGGDEPIEKTVSGSIVSFSDAIAAQLKALSVAVEPIQDLHGYDNPWPAGGGKNLLENKLSTVTSNGVTFTVNSDGSMVLNGTATGVAQRNVNSALSLPAGQYVLSGMAAGGGSSTRMLYAASGASIIARDTGAGASFTLTEETTISIMCWVNNGQTVSNVAVYPMIRLASESDGTFAPYSNICPISGWTGAKVTRTGKNLLDKANVLQNMFINTSAKKISPIGATGACVYCPIKGGEKYTVSKMVSARFTIATTSELPAQNVAINNHVGDSSATHLTIQTTEADRYIVAFVYLESADTGKTQQEILDTVQCELGSTATSYEPYQGTTYTIAFPSEAGTVYGGTLDVVTGVLTVTKICVDGGSFTWSKVSGNSYRNFVTSSFQSGKIPKYANARTTVISSVYVGKNNDNAPASGDNYVWIRSGPQLAVKDTSKSALTAAEFKTAMTGVQFCYELATPLEITLTPTQIDTLLGTNNVWADAGDVTVTYLADGNASDAEALGILLGGRYTPSDDVTDKEALDIILGGAK